MAKPLLSVIIPTLNEEKDLSECLESVKNLADDLLVVDSGSVDDTVKIAKKFNARVLVHPFASYSDQRNYCDSQAKGEWILSLEADVKIPTALAVEIKEAIKNKNFDAYFIGRVNIIWGKPIMHTDWGPKDDTHIWLYRKGVGKWQSLVHEEYKTSGKVGYLKNNLIHKNYETVSEFIDKINRYSDFAIRQKNYYPGWWFIRDFFKRYIYKLGFLDGYRGLFLSYLQSIYFISLSVKRYTNRQ